MRHTSIFAACSLLLLQYHHAVDAAVPLPTDSDMTALQQRRTRVIVHSNSLPASETDIWAGSLQPSGVWSDIDMTSGCGARLSNWPATVHLDRTRALAVAYAKNASKMDLFEKAISALAYWLDHDFTEMDCLDRGGRANYNCPCGTPGLWNKNWFAQVIAIPTRIGDICMLLRDKLTDSQKAGCAAIQSRAFESRTRGSKPASGLTGANLSNVASIGFTLGLFENNATQVKRALDIFYNAAVISPTVAGDGIQADGSFMQHAGLLYNGNYGKDYIFDSLSIFLTTKNTPQAPDTEAQEAFKTLIDGSEWMMVADTKLNALLWQYSAIGRMITFRYSDKQASGGVSTNISDIAESTEGWDTHSEFEEIVTRLEAPHTINANQGNLVGTRYFYNADYMVHRAPNYVATMKMYSTRTINAECTNIQNPFGYHLSDGAIYNYITGDEYVDTFGAWNWELIPGVTVDYGGTALRCDAVKKKGKKDFIGGVTDQNTGIAVMDYLNPTNGNLAAKKSAFFFPSAYAIQVAAVTSKNASAPLVTVLDQKRRNGDIYVSGKVRNTDTAYTVTEGTNSIWHDSIGYYFPKSEVIHVDSTPRNTDWSSIGISNGTEEIQLFTSYIEHTKVNGTGLLTEYIVQPSIAAKDFEKEIKSGKLPISLDFSAKSPQVNAAYSAADKSIAVVFWTAGTYTAPWSSVRITTNSPCTLILRQIHASTYRLTISDPSQKLTDISLNVTIAKVSKTVEVKLPTGNKAGQGVFQLLSFN